MRRSTCCLAAVVLAAAPARAASILFATAASQNRVNGFCVRGDGSLAPSPKVSIGTAGVQPRRLLAANGALYVAELDRVEAFRIGAHGGLVPLGSIKALVSPNMDPGDVAVSADGTMLYVPQVGQHRIAAYPLDADGAPAKDFTTCIQGPEGAQYQRIIIQGSLLYVTADILGGRISVFPVNPDGSLEAQPDACKAGTSPSPVTCPLSERRMLLTPRAFVLNGDLLYVESLGARQIFAFQLTNGLFNPPFRKRTGEVVSVCLKDANGKDLTGNFKYQKALSKTAVLQQYQDLVLRGAALFGSQFTHGRTDAFGIKPDGRLSKRPKTRTKEDVLTSPVGLAASDTTLYVAGGELDRVQAFRLRRSSGQLATVTPFSQTDEQVNSFPNALALTDLTDSCE